MSDSQKRLLLVVGWLIFSFLFAVFFIEDFVRDIVIRPLMYLAWVGELFVRSLPQNLFWFLFVLAVAIGVLRLLRFRIPRRTRMQTVSIGLQGPVARWQGQLHRAARLEYSRFNLNRSLRKLVLDLTLSEAEQDLSGSMLTEADLAIDVPDELKPLLMVRDEDEFGRRSLMDRLLALVPLPLSQQAEHRRPAEAVASYLEFRLGMAANQPKEG